MELACWGVWADPEQNSSAHFLGRGQEGLSPVRPDTPPAQRGEASDVTKRESSERGTLPDEEGRGCSASKPVWELWGYP